MKGQLTPSGEERCTEYALIAGSLLCLNPLRMRGLRDTEVGQVITLTYFLIMLTASQQIGQDSLLSLWPQCRFIRT